MNYNEIIKSIKDAVVANNIEVNILSHVMWDVCKKEYKLFINENVDFYYKFPNGETCTNFNPSFNLQDFMSTSDEDLVEELNKQCEEYKWELDNMIEHYNAQINGEQD